MKELQYAKVRLKVFDTREEMGKTAALDAAGCLRELLECMEQVNCVFAAAPSQNEFLEALIAQPGIDWGRVNAFHMDEYLGFPVGDSRSFNGFLTRKVFDKAPLRSVNLLNGEAESGAECARYTALLRDNPIDVVFMGIGDNGHIAFNDPPVADFHDPALVKVVDLDITCRVQQVNDGCFPTLEDVPLRAMTLTIPALMAAERVFCIVPGKRKAQAVKDALTGSVAVSCPASILQNKDRVMMYVDRDAASELAI